MLARAAEVETIARARAHAAAMPGSARPAYAAEQINLILARATDREENTPHVETAVDRIVAPLMYRILFRPAGLDAAYARRFVTEFFCIREKGDQ